MQDQERDQVNPVKYVYFFGGSDTEGNRDQKELLGGKGANLAEMTRIGLPVPPGFTITTEACRLFYQQGEKLRQRHALPTTKAERAGRKVWKTR